MPSQLLSLNEAAAQLDVSRRRVEELVRSNTLHAVRIGNQWVVTIEDVRALAHNRWRVAGRPLSQNSAWRMIQSLEAGKTHCSAAALDRQRRRLRARAHHLEAYAHPGLLDKIRSDRRVVLGGRDAALSYGAPADQLESVDLYVSDSNSKKLLKDYAIRINQGIANVHLHAIEDATWPFVASQQFVGLWVSWLDLADAQDRASTLVLDRIAGRPSRA